MLKPWAFGPFELLLHAELHLRDRNDFDRRIALISFDNSIEVSVTTYLTLHPIQRGNRTYNRADVENWLNNYHTKLDFFFDEVTTRALALRCNKDEIIWYHGVRNDQYHAGRPSIPSERDLNGVRDAAFWIFEVLYDVTDVETLITDEIISRSAPPLPQRTPEDDRAIDTVHGTIEIVGRNYYTSETLYGVDPVAYSELAAQIRARPQTPEPAKEDE